MEAALLFVCIVAGLALYFRIVRPLIPSTWCDR